MQSQKSPSGPPWLLLALLVLSICINYIDRGTLPVAAGSHSLQSDLGITDKDLGLLFSAFFWTYAFFQLVAGWLIDRYSVFVVFTVGFVLWSGATLATGLATGFASVLMLRLILGAGEAVAYPSYSKFLATEQFQKHRGFANSLIDAGSRTGPAIGIMVGGMIAAKMGWRALFLIIGGVGFLWLIPWMLNVKRLRTTHDAAVATGASPSFGDILSRRQAWGTFFGLFCLNYIWYFVLSWLPKYLTQERHLTTEAMAIYGSLPFWGVAGMSALCGWWSDRLVARGAAASKVRIGFVSAGMLFGALILPACAMESQTVMMVLLVAGCLGLGMTSSNLWAVTQTISGPSAAGRWTGLQNGFGNLAGIAGPYVTGLLLERTGSFYAAFAVAAAVSIAGAVCYLFVVRSVEPVRWRA
jgi:MFS family permease